MGSSELRKHAEIWQCPKCAILFGQLPLDFDKNGDERREIEDLKESDEIKCPHCKSSSSYEDWIEDRLTDYF